MAAITGTEQQFKKQVGQEKEGRGYDDLIFNKDKIFLLKKYL